jgi:hypothetical protein
VGAICLFHFAVFFNFIIQENPVSMAKRTLINFDWAVKRLLRKKASFGILNGFFSELLQQDVAVVHMLESEGNQETAEDKANRVCCARIPLGNCWW